MRRIVSVSLGSSKRDHRVSLNILGQDFVVERIGTDGNMARAIELLRSLDGQVDVFGLGGIDLYLCAGGRKYAIRDALKMRKAVVKSRVVDGSGLKNSLEYDVIKEVDRNLGPLRGKKALQVSSVDRFGMAEALTEVGCQTTFGDFIFGLGIPIPLRSLRAVKIVAWMLLPLITKLPFRILYPLGSEQEKEPKKKYLKYYRDADILAGDFLYIRRYLPLDLKGKWIITNTITSEDVELLRSRGAELLITTTPGFEGRSFGTNVIEAILVSLLEKPPEMLQSEDYRAMLSKIGFQPQILKLQSCPL
ncbi:hypothetical protein HKBW3S44_00259 [Candidatus Hakubella thermalkaliphila]|uniref:Quinate 5-dehydrogenase n=3 Tax=Candidatus Hakubella thermalkaliphila TaxID=2754717 RepID=A0A6V8NQM1_9ACTN|nr:quinate 5-dehydrogenase [Candidatus Hakubella thermalkaliphila]GFP22565.1 hypothetical protein HKBW3S09_00032 [Candidatus Hakubella thermalkaliphila]GFP30394.1 hypothetical protein HKBW3S34_01315 [Candidatus Hakubella thermalkaliphila]GFP36576.1 hypothetical protein HKBW3S44_00259 [Candidatus Hakubella thermalkaliphila]GFP38475.1 hypothetical protein HKBW3S47_00176 [Candidatus Hakubella thermalkaliphila]